MLVSYVAGEGVELTVHKKSVAVEEIKEVELRSRRAHFIYERNCNRLGLQPRGHAPSRLPVKKLRRLLQRRRKVRVFVWEGIRKNIISYYSSVFLFYSSRFLDGFERLSAEASFRTPAYTEKMKPLLAGYQRHLTEAKSNNVCLINLCSFRRVTGENSCDAIRINN